MSSLPILTTRSPLDDPLKTLDPPNTLPFFPSPLAKSHARSMLFHLLFPSSPRAPKLTMRNVSRFLSSAAGLDKGLMALQYPPKVVVWVLLGLIRILTQRETSRSIGSVTSSRNTSRRILLGTIESLSNLSSTIGDARTLMRIFGLIHTLSSHPSHPSLSIEYVQSILLLVYFPLEHLVYFHSHGIGLAASMTQSTSDWVSVWSCRAWAGYVMVDLYASYLARGRLLEREADLRRRRKEVDVEEVMEKKGYSLRPGSDANPGEKEVGDQRGKEVLHAESEKLGLAWADWTDALIVNAGYAPLTVHWSLPNGLWANPAWTGLFGTLACFAGIRKQWRNLG